MAWTTLHLTVVTPLFSGDDPTSPTADAPVRVPSIRGALRFWFRAVAAGHGVTGLEDLWTQEKQVFGTTNTPSPISIRVSTQPPANGKGSKPDWAMFPKPTGPKDTNRFRGAQYLLGQGLWSYKTGVTRPFVAPGQSVDLDIRFAADDTTNARFMLALWAWLTYGGLGARTRRGFGQLTCTAVDGSLPAGWQAEHLSPPASKQDWKTLGEQAVPQHLPAPASRGWPAVVSSQPDTNEDLPEFPALCSRWWSGQTMGGTLGSLGEALHIAGRELRLFRAADPSTTDEPGPTTRSPEWLHTIHGSDQRYPIAALGLPVGYFSRPTNDRPSFKATVDPHGAGPLRRASPVWIRPVQVSHATWTVFTHVFWARLLPEGARLVISGDTGPRDLLVPDRDVTECAWDAWLANEYRLPPSFY